MAIYETKLLKKETVAHNTMAFTFEKPEGFDYKAGQFGDIIILDPKEPEGNMHGFSFVSEPFEENIVMATRMRDTPFKRNIKDLPDGTTVKLDGPYGDYRLHKTETTPAVFIIGGIGITPVKGIVAEATREKKPHDITLLYANRTPEDAAFLGDFEQYAKENTKFNFVPVMTRADSEKWDGEKGHVDAAMLKRHVSDVSKPIYYLSGPAGMVRSMREMLVEAGANEDNIRTEEFSGY